MSAGGMSNPCSLMVTVGGWGASIHKALAPGAKGVPYTRYTQQVFLGSMGGISDGGSGEGDRQRLHEVAGERVGPGLEDQQDVKVLCLKQH